MDKFHKIYTLFERDEKKKVIEENWNPLMPFEFLQNCVWRFDEKVDGMNIRIIWDGAWFSLEGRNDNSSIPSNLANYLYRRLESYRTVWKSTFDSPVAIYGEGFGNGIQGKMGIEYAKESCPVGDVGFRIFDVKIGDWWLERHNVIDIAKKVHFDVVPMLGQGTLHDAADICKKGFTSQLGKVTAEGIIVRPSVDIFTRKGERIIGKIKYKDFAKHA